MKKWTERHNIFKVKNEILIRDYYSISILIVIDISYRNATLFNVTSLMEIFIGKGLSRHFPMIER